jgi:hypothetical protein
MKYLANICALAASQRRTHIAAIDPADGVGPAGSGDLESVSTWPLSGFPWGC